MLYIILKKGHLMWIRCLCVKLGERGRYTFVFLFQPYGESSRNRATYLQSRDQTPQGCILNYSNTPVQREFFVLLNTIGNPHPPANFMTIHILPLRLLSQLYRSSAYLSPKRFLFMSVMHLGNLLTTLHILSHLAFSILPTLVSSQDLNLNILLYTPNSVRMVSTYSNVFCVVIILDGTLTVRSSKDDDDGEEEAGRINDGHGTAGGLKR